MNKIALMTVLALSLSLFACDEPEGSGAVEPIDDAVLGDETGEAEDADEELVCACPEEDDGCFDLVECYKELPIDPKIGGTAGVTYIVSPLEFISNCECSTGQGVNIPAKWAEYDCVCSWNTPLPPPV